MVGHSRQLLVEVFETGARFFSRVHEAFQKVVLGDSVSRCCNRVRMETKFLGVVSVMNMMSIHLKDFDGRGSRVLNHVVDLYISAEGDQLFV